jgi:hypothetical protein
MYVYFYLYIFQAAICPSSGVLIDTINFPDDVHIAAQNM